MNNLKFLLLISCAVFLVDCTKDLDRTPENGLTADKLFANEAGYRSNTTLPLRIITFPL